MCWFYIRIIWNWWRFFNDTSFNIFGIPPAFAVANEANNILGTSVSGALTHWFRKTLDYKMGIVLFWRYFGTFVGMIIFDYLKEMGI